MGVVRAKGRSADGNGPKDVTDRFLFPERVHEVRRFGRLWPNKGCVGSDEGGGASDLAPSARDVMSDTGCVSADLGSVAHTDNAPFPRMLEFDIAENPLRDDVAVDTFRPQPGGLPVPTGPGL